MQSILSLRAGRDVFIVGAANVGKSAFVRRMLKEMSHMSSRHFDMMASHASLRMPTESAMPGTTLGRVALAAFSSGGHLYDTPGARGAALEHVCSLLHAATRVLASAPVLGDASRQQLKGAQEFGVDVALEIARPGARAEPC
jgi:GTPase SAR1 family protein